MGVPPVTKPMTDAEWKPFREAIEGTMHADIHALDVERLARALWNTNLRTTDDDLSHAGPLPQRKYREWAATIAAEYARLAAEPAP